MHVDGEATHAPAASHTASPARCSSDATSERAHKRKRGIFREDVPGHRHRFKLCGRQFVLFTVDSCGYMSKAPASFIGQLGRVFAASKSTPEGAQSQWAMRLRSASLQVADMEAYCKAGLAISARSRSSRQICRGGICHSFLEVGGFKANCPTYTGWRQPWPQLPTRSQRRWRSLRPRAGYPTCFAGANQTRSSRSGPMHMQESQ